MIINQYEAQLIAALTRSRPRGFRYILQANRSIRHSRGKRTNSTDSATFKDLNTFFSFFLFSATYDTLRTIAVVRARSNVQGSRENGRNNFDASPIKMAHAKRDAYREDGPGGRHASELTGRTVEGQEQEGQLVRTA